MKQLLTAILILLYVSEAITTQAQTKSRSKQLKDFDTYVENARKKWNAVGLAVTVVRNNEVIFEKGYGLKEINTTNLVDVNTLFACGSTTKAMTATCMGILVDQGKVAWDDPVGKYLPEFQLFDPYVTRELTVRDLFLHNSGVGNTDYLWAWMNIPAGEILQRMRLVEPSYSFRSGFIYQNIFYLAAGKVIEKVGGQPWSQFMKENIFNPLGMTSTFPLLKSITSSNVTKPHMMVDGKLTVIEDLSADEIGAAGSVWSSIHDIGKWTMCMLDSGKHKGGRLVKPETWIEMTKPQTFVTASQFYPTAQITKPNWTTYGLGWFQHDYKGRKLNFHTGSLPGSIAIHGQLPEENLAVYVFGNTDHVEVRHAIMYKALDMFATGGSTDWSEDLFNLYSTLNQGYENSTTDFEKKRIIGTKPSLPLESYNGLYRDELYGEVKVERINDQLRVNINDTQMASLSHWHYDTFRGDFEKNWFGKLTATFQLDNLGNIESIDLDGIKFKKAR